MPKKVGNFLFFYGRTTGLGNSHCTILPYFNNISYTGFGGEEGISL
jgi:hypothetical protein